MGWGVVAAVAAAVCYGVASVLQAVGARRVSAGNPLRALTQPPYLAGLALDGLGFAAQVLALRSLPVFAVQAALAASLAVTAVAAFGSRVPTYVAALATVSAA